LFTEAELQTVCFTGHRLLPESETAVAARLDLALTRLYGWGCRCFCAGGARGFDTLAAEAVLRLRRDRVDVRLHLVLPFPRQYTYEGDWTGEELRRFRRLLEAADRRETLAERYAYGVFRERNRRMVDLSSVCVAYMLRSGSGAGQTVSMARAAGLSVFNLAAVPGELPPAERPVTTEQTMF
jgi:hypothetical protein